MAASTLSASLNSGAARLSASGRKELLSIPGIAVVMDGRLEKHPTTAKLEGRTRARAQAAARQGARACTGAAESPRCRDLYTPRTADILYRYNCTAPVTVPVPVHRYRTGTV